MKESVYRRIIDELGKMKYAGRISPHFYGEPLMDKRLPDLIAYTRKKCPYAYIRFSSNGDFLTEKLLKRLIYCGVDMMLVTNYDEHERARLLGLVGKYRGYVQYRDFEDIRVVNRAGQFFANKGEEIDDPCLRPCRQLVINWKGNVLLCCNDYYEGHILGNVEERSIREIWRDKSFDCYRDALGEKGGRREIDICKNCDL